MLIASSLLPPGDAAALPRPAMPAWRRAALNNGPPRFLYTPYLQDVSTSGLIVAFATEVTTTALVRIYEPTDNATEAQEGRARTPKAVFLSPPAMYHRVRVYGLSPGARYTYIVAVRRPGDAAQLEVSTIEAELSTAPMRGAFSFLVYGDNRDRDADHAAVINAMISEHADLVLQTGDMVSRANDEAQWRRYFATASPLLRSAPLYPVLGNHELRGDPEAWHFHRQFVLPRAVPRLPRRRPVYYAFRYSNALFVALDGNSPYDGDQAAWLERTLHASSTDTTLRHIFAFIHQPPFAVGAYCGSERVARRLVPILQRYPVRAVFGGHEHAYQHLERDGLRFFISGGGGAPLYPRSQACNFEDDLALRLFRAEHHYLRIQIDGDAATLYAINQKGTLMERVPLHEPIPEVPQQPPPPLPDDAIDAPPPPNHNRETPLLSMGTAGVPGLPDAGADAGADTAAAAVSASTQTATQPQNIPALKALPSRRASAQASFGPLLLLWLSSIALLAGLLMLTRDLRLRRR